MTEITFEPWPKIPRLKRGCVITEKIDGTNAQVIITDDGRIGAASRTRLITPEQDNMGFARWVEENKEELLKLGPGRHYGEWYGQKIQRTYGLDHKRFALFNTKRWWDHYTAFQAGESSTFPACCEVVPVLFAGPFTDENVEWAMNLLRTTGSIAVPGFMRPEGIVVFHVAAGQMFKRLLENDDVPKGVAEDAA